MDDFQVDVLVVGAGNAAACAALAWQLGVTPAVLGRMQRHSERWLGMPWSAFNVPDLGRVRPVPPTLVIHDRDDKEVRWEDGAAIAGAWPGARLETTTGLGHRRILRDPVVIQRRRLKLFFGYDHVFEAYVPKAKRRFGYFVLPVLLGDEMVAALDLKTDRAAGKLLIQSWHWLAAGRPRSHKRAIEEELHRFEAFQLGD